MMTDLWPDDLYVSKIQAPVTILREQAYLLGERTKNLVEGKVRPINYPSNSVLFNPNNFGYDFVISAPTLNYQYTLFSIKHDLDFYPIEIQFDGFDDIYSTDITVGRNTASNEDDFIRKLRVIFRSSKTKKLIQALLSQLEFKPSDLLVPA